MFRSEHDVQWMARPKDHHNARSWWAGPIHHLCLSYTPVWVLLNLLWCWNPEIFGSKIQVFIFLGEIHWGTASQRYGHGWRCQRSPDRGCGGAGEKDGGGTGSVQWTFSAYWGGCVAYIVSKAILLVDTQMSWAIIHWYYYSEKSNIMH